MALFHTRYDTVEHGPLDMLITADSRAEAAAIVRQEPYLMCILSIEELQPKTGG